ncbi:MAG TPA: TonB family protein, partial [Flavobacteriales bacterium]|nr:TonB family protein [Flavobacteriales bacterium]
MIRSILLATTVAISFSALAQTATPCMPVGSIVAFERLLEQELVYPPEAMEAGIKGEVVVGVMLGQHGKAISAKVGKSLSPECDAEALRLVNLVLWRPGVAGEDCSGVEHFLSVKFDPSKYKRWLKARHTQNAKVLAMPIDTSLAVRTVKELNTQVSPVIPNGMAGLPRYIAQEMRYPEQAFRNSLDGTVQLEFVVEPSGTLSNMPAIQEVGGGCNDEA